MLIYIRGDGAKACAPIGSPPDLVLAEAGFKGFCFLLNTDEYRNKPVSWETFANLIEGHSTDLKAVAIVAAIRRCTTVVPLEYALEELL